MKEIRVLICLLLVLFLAACGRIPSQPVVSDEKADTEQGTNNPDIEPAINNPDTEMEINEEDNEQTIDTEQKAEPVIEAEAGFSYADLNGIEFWFGSGVGAWRTTLTIAEDGSFKGEYSDSDMGDTGDRYPYGTQYYCAFMGKFNKLTKVDDLTYTTEIETISFENEERTEEIIDGVRFIYTDAYGLDDSKTIYFYLKGTQVSGLSEGVLSWVQSALYDYKTNQSASELPFIVLYNENNEQAFTSYDITE